VKTPVTNDVRIPIASGADIVTARVEGRRIASEGGFCGLDLTVIATAISELARNIVEYARDGEIIMTVIQEGNKKGFRMEARDKGPGIPNVELALQDGYSTGGGLGMGLPGTKRLMDEFTISSRNGGTTTVTATKWKRRAESENG
jgi:serine/threonine-protein kinase RsbT